MLGSGGGLGSAVARTLSFEGALVAPAGINKHSVSALARELPKSLALKREHVVRVVAPTPNPGISNTLRASLLGRSKTLFRETAANGITTDIVVPGRIATRRVAQLDSAKDVCPRARACRGSTAPCRMGRRHRGRCWPHGRCRGRG